MRIRTFLGISAACVVLAPALAQAAPQPRTFVSAKKGSDAANCSRTSPCRTFGRAIAVTTPGGEVVVLDSGGYGAVTISQAVSLEAPEGIYAGITASTGDAITVAAGVNDVVVLRGLTLTGTSAAGNGITVVSAGTVHVEHCTIRGFTAGNGILATDGSFQLLNLEDTVVAECNMAFSFSPGSASPPSISMISLIHCRFENSQTAAMFLEGFNDGSLVSVTLSECNISSSLATDGIEISDNIELTLDRCVIASKGSGRADVSGLGHSVVYITNSVIPNSYGGLRVNSRMDVCLFGNNFIANIVGTVNHCSLQ